MEKIIKSIVGGVLIGIIFIVVGYSVITLVFEALTNLNLIDAVSSNSIGKRVRSVWLFAICINVIVIQFFNKRAYHKTQRGIAIATVLAALTWVIIFKDTLFSELN